MATQLRSHLTQKILTCLKSSGLGSVSNKLLNTALRVNSSRSAPKNSIELQIPLNVLVSPHDQKNVKKNDLHRIGNEIIKTFETDETFKGIALSPPESKNTLLNFQINSNTFFRKLLHDVWTCADEDYVAEKLFALPKEQIIVEFSSPNIAKPFHVGHLRSTMLGNFVSNLLQSMGHNVKRINYLGDWGTQFGLLQFGIARKWYTMADIARDPIKILLEIYVRANQMAEADETVAAEARNLFRRMESGDEDVLKDWSVIRQFTIDELIPTYGRLGVHFDEFHWESNYGIESINSVLNALKKLGILFEHDGKQVVALDNDQRVTLVKSDGSSLYLTRDLAAAIDRRNRYRFQRMYYVVDGSQSNHFAALKNVLKLMGNSEWSDSLEHVKFGRIQGMSTRRGTAIHLTQLLDEAFNRMKTKQMQSPTTKVDVDTNPDVTDTLAVTSIIINDLKQRRQKDYVFNWDNALQDKGDSGTRLQYTHSRLCSLETNCGVVLPSDIAHVQSDMSDVEPEMMDLLRDLARFRQILEDSYHQLEPCILVRYLFDLSHSTSAALKLLPVKNQPVRVATTRLALFSTAKRILGIGLRILGVKPLTKM